jgi:hypothetical protein
MLMQLKRLLQWWQEIVVMEHEIASVAKWIPVFPCNTVFSSSRVKLLQEISKGHFLTLVI